MSREQRSCVFYLVRHGQTEDNVKRIIIGHRDSPLTELGIRQAQSLKTILKEINFAAVYSSDLGRCIQTAQIITGGRQPIPLTQLRERSYGIFEGQPSAAYRQAFAVLIENRKKLPENERQRLKFHRDIESDGEVFLRFSKALQKIAAHQDGGNILVVTHEGCLFNFLINTGFAQRENLPGGVLLQGGYIKVILQEDKFYVDKVVNLAGRN